MIKPGTRLGKPVGLLPSGLDVALARERAIQLFSEGHAWPENRRGAGVYELSKASIKKLDSKRWSGSLLVSSQINKFFRTMVVPAAVVAAGAFYAAIIPDVVTDLGLKIGERTPPSLFAIIGIFSIAIATGFFLAFTHMKAKHMVSVYRTALELAAKPPPASRSRAAGRARLTG